MISSIFPTRGIAERQRKFLEGSLIGNLGSRDLGQSIQLSQLEKIAEEFGSYLVKKTPDVLESLDLVSSGDLKASGLYDIVIKGNEILSLRFWLADHWVNVHYGEKRSRSQGAKPPPLAAIERWISEKGIEIRESAGESAESVLNKRAALAEKIQAAIWRRGYTIKRFGPKGSRFLDQVLDQDSLDALAELMGELGAAAVAFDILSVVPINPANGPRG